MSVPFHLNLSWQAIKTALGFIKKPELPAPVDYAIKVQEAIDKRDVSNDHATLLGQPDEHHLI